MPQSQKVPKWKQCSSARKALTFYRLRKSYWIQLRGRDYGIRIKQPKSCNLVRYKVQYERKNSFAARRAYARWVKQHTLLDFVVTSGNHAWHKAVKQAQKPYPGTESWLLSCSSSEGGWGRWVPNSEGSGVGGWMQMYPSTWSTMFYGWYGNEGALSWLKRKGFFVPKSAHSWYSPLGQALASAHGKMNGRGGEWHGSGC